MVVKWSGIRKALPSMSLFTFEDTEVFELRPIAASYLPAVETLELPQNGKPICWMKMSATDCLVFLHWFWQLLISAARRYAVGAARRRVFLLTVVRSRSVMPITRKLLFCTAHSSSHPVIIRQHELTFTLWNKVLNVLIWSTVLLVWCATWFKYSTNCMMFHLI
jgi:hypothetical protein